VYIGITDFKSMSNITMKLYTITHRTNDVSSQFSIIQHQQYDHWKSVTCIKMTKTKLITTEIENDLR